MQHDYMDEAQVAKPMYCTEMEIDSSMPRDPNVNIRFKTKINRTIIHEIGYNAIQHLYHNIEYHNVKVIILRTCPSDRMRSAAQTPCATRVTPDQYPYSLP
jgi:hypothetical protein